MRPSSTFLTRKTSFAILWLSLMSIIIFWFTQNGVNILNLNNVSLSYMASYQMIMLVFSLITLLISVLLSSKTSLSLLNLTKIDGQIKPSPLLNLFPLDKNDTWKSFGLRLTVMIGLVTSIVVFLQNPMTGFKLWPTLGLAIIFAVSNSWIEEIIFRFLMVSVSMHEHQDRFKSHTLLIASLSFGLLHYWGAPGGFLGVLMAAYLGYIMAKSIYETKGFFWAWMIHFVLDFIIFMILLNTI